MVSDLKFVCRDETSKSMEELVSDLKSISPDFPIDSSFFPSQITECPRRIIYRVRGTTYISKESIFKCVKKESFKNKWISLLEKSKSIKVLHKDVIASDCNYNLYSKADCVINLKGDILAVKSIQVTKDEFNQVYKKGAMKKHVIEMVVYIWLLEVDSGLIIYESEEEDFYIFHIKPYKSIINSVIDKCTKLCDFKLKGQIPNRPYKLESKECEVCEYKSLCWKNKED